MMESEVLASQGRPQMGLIVTEAIGAMLISAIESQTSHTSGRPQMGLRILAIGAIVRGSLTSQIRRTFAGGPIKLLIRGSTGASSRSQMGRSPEEVLLFIFGSSSSSTSAPTSRAGSPRG